MSQYCVPQMIAASQLTTEYLSLHQQRRYFLDNLANQEAREETLANILEVTKVKLSAAKNSTEGSQRVKTLKKSRRNLSYKLRICQRTEKALSDKLAVMTARMSFLEQTQWCRTNFDCNQAAQYGQLDGLAAGMQNMGLVSPMTPSFPTTSFGSGFVSPMTRLSIYSWSSAYPPPVENCQLFSPTPALQPYCGLTYLQFTNQQPEADPSQESDVFENSETTMETNTEMSLLHLPMHDFVPTQRAFSLPDLSIQYTSRSADQSPTVDTIDSCTEDVFGLTRKLSLVDRGSSALRLQRKFH